MRALLVAYLLHITINPLLFLKGRNVFKNNKLIRIVWSAVFITEFLIFSTVLILSKYLSASFVHFGRVLGTSWMLFIIYTVGLILIFDFFYLLIRRKLLKPLELKNQPEKIKQPMLIAILVLVITVMIHGNYKFEHPVITQHNITIDKDGGHFDSLKIVVAGDFHLGYTINRNDARRMVDLIMEQNADIIFLIGDIIDAGIEPLFKERMDEELKRLSAPLGVFSCPGNHEYRNEKEEKFEFLENSGITLLRDQTVLVDSSFYIIGREDFIIKERIPLTTLIEENALNRDKPIIVLNHSPYDINEETDANIDLALYGHTHHGQAFPGNIMIERRFELPYGYKKKDNTHHYVTSGIGLAGPQHRIGTVSEIAVINVKFGGIEKRN